MQSIRHTIPLLLILGSACALVLSSGGCAAMGLVAHAVTPPPKVPPKFVLPAEPTIVLVDSSTSAGQTMLDGQHIARRASESMRAAGLNFVLDSSLAVEQQSRHHPDGSRLRPSEVARACGARQFVYIDLTRYGTTSGMSSDGTNGQAEAAVWVVDAQSAQVLWPPQANQGHPLGVTVPFRPSTAGTSEQAIRTEMNEMLGEKAGRLFFEWREPEVAEQYPDGR